jgi:hypothetical protein
VGNAKLQAKRTTTSLDINSPQTSDNPQTSDVSTSKDKKKSPVPFSNAFMVSAFVSSALADNKNTESLQHFWGLDDYELAQSMSDSLSDFLRKMNPRDPLDSLALQQLYMHSLRAISLCAKASNERDVEKSKILHGAADSASNTYRRLMQSFDERRKPARQSIVAMGQTNVAEQQVVQNIQSDGQKKSQTN